MKICVICVICGLYSFVCLSQEVKVATNTATIRGVSSVAYGESMDRMDNFAFSLTGTETILFNLEPGTIYWYKMDPQITQIKMDPQITQITQIGSFTTLGRPPVRFEWVRVGSVTKTSANVEWRTNLKTDCELQVGNLNSRGAKRQRIIEGLMPDTFYSFQIIACDEEGQVGTYAGQFKTLENNLALGCRVFGTFDQLPKDKYVSKGNPLQRITDGDLSYFNGMAQSGDITLDDQWLVIDLGTETKISTITVYWRALAYSQDYSILASKSADYADGLSADYADGKNWVVLAEGLNGDDGERIRSESGDPMRIQDSRFKIQNSRFRYVKIFCKKGSSYFHKHEGWNFIQIMEVKVF